MKNGSFHPTDQQLLLFTEGEAQPRLGERIRIHLAACWECRKRIAELERSIGDVIEVHRQVLDPQVPPIDGARARLRARMAELERSALSNERSPLLQPWWAIHLAWVSALVLLIVFGAGMLRHHRIERHRIAADNPWMLPNPRLTPGVTTTSNLDAICSIPDDQVVAPVTRRLKRKVFKEYGIAGDPTANYEVDYLITPGLGGSDDIRNLWPEPRYNTLWNSLAKDQLEEYLHRAVCGGRISLPVAQHEIESNWIAAYKKYFHTNSPIPAGVASRTSMLSRSWGGDQEIAGSAAWFLQNRVIQD